jgi:hypothetical protein
MNAAIPVTDLITSTLQTSCLICYWIQANKKICYNTTAHTVQSDFRQLLNLMEGDRLH